MSRLLWSVVLDSVLIGAAASSVAAGQFYYVEKELGSHSMNTSDGVSSSELFNTADLEALFPVDLKIPTAMEDLKVDTFQQKLYWIQRWHLDGQFARWTVMRCNLDGSNIEIAPGFPVGNSDEMIHLELYTPPAVSTWGFGIMLMLLIAVGTIAFMNNSTSNQSVGAKQ